MFVPSRKKTNLRGKCNLGDASTLLRESLTNYQYPMALPTSTELRSPPADALFLGQLA
jgi:hypothetical protein